MRCPGVPHRGHASSDWTCPYERSNTTEISEGTIMSQEFLSELRLLNNTLKNIATSLSNIEDALESSSGETRDLNNQLYDLTRAVEGVPSALDALKPNQSSTTKMIDAGLKGKPWDS